MIRTPLGRIRRLAAGAALGCAALAAAVPVAADTLLFMRIDGVKGNNPPKQPLGADAFQIMNFDIAVKKADEEKNERFEDVKITLPLSATAVQLWQLAAQGQTLAKAEMVAIDVDSGEIRYRADLEQVVVRSFALQTLGKRDAAVGALRYQRVRVRYGDGKDATAASWDRERNAPWK